MKYNTNKNNIEKILFDIEKELEEKHEILNELLKIDQQYCKMKTDMKMLKTVINLLKYEKVDIQKEQKVSIKYNGNPCITLNLSILAILTKSTIILDCTQNMIGVNRFIIKIVNNVLNKFQISELLYLENQFNEKEIDKIICIDDINKYNSYLRENNTKAKFYSYNYLDFYSDCDEYEEIEELIYKFAEENQIPIETYSGLKIEDAAQMMKNGLGKIAVVLTSDKEIKRVFEENIKNKELYINKNPFQQNIRLLDREILYMK